MANYPASISKSFLVMYISRKSRKVYLPIPSHIHILHPLAWNGKIDQKWVQKFNWSKFLYWTEKEYNFVDYETESKPDLKNKTSDFFSILTRPKIEQ